MACLASMDGMPPSSFFISAQLPSQLQRDLTALQLSGTGRALYKSHMQIRITGDKSFSVQVLGC